MKKLLNTIYITSPDVFVALDGETIVIKKEETVGTKIPLHNIENIVCFNYIGVSPALMKACVDKNIGLCFLTPYGKFQARIIGPVHGNVLLRKKQYAVSEAIKESLPYCKAFLLGKIGNCRKVLERALRDHEMVVNTKKIKEASDFLKEVLRMIPDCNNLSDLFAFEGSAARAYFGVFNELILQQKEDFLFTDRSRRPPMDNMNALLSFLYTLLAYEVASALETVGLDPYVGFLHQDRPGRISLALDIMEELRPVLADRLALSLVNRKQITGSGFIKKESGGVLMDEETRKTVLQSWQEKKQETLTHPYLKELIPYGLLPYVQSMLLAKSLRNDIDGYPPFFWN
ncbi:type I-C CRISPR-associated endonuclease Cas1c [Gracilinema caldarium]|uniref:CRISPR-associated endonuclease Cas1 n=1 Tax=Gracilinema caldarium (strain ATCC 51460 / DSM 7334 / H1) TaxID=744872 RepID=F8F435_GRAC1|nr:type I-C CRISPR-associated endonuclease Cas1c [Gracilinema caldarium]AEJ20054.1 CRISPR-associated protein Cas1 [Gracilinema caldarium DSM 7334]